MATYFVSDKALLQLSAEQPERAGVYGPLPTGGLAWWDRLSPESSLDTLSQPRCAQSPKGFFLSAAESVCKYGGEAAAVATQTQPTVLLGVRACELRAGQYLDKVMTGGDFNDPVYAARREAMTIVSCDCVAFTETCFCTQVGGAPYARDGYDANLTPVEGGFLVEVATEKGRAWLGDGALQDASPQQLAARDKIREQAVEQIRLQNAEIACHADDRTPPALPEGDSQDWQQFAADCVECAACTNICPTCHCFYLYDQVLGADAFERVRTWDSCLLSTYHRMAGGVNMKLSPRPALSSRLANRILHKFTYSPQQYELLGCVGCGRCIDACLGDIDIREVVATLGNPPREHSE